MPQAEKWLARCLEIFILKLLEDVRDHGRFLCRHIIIQHLKIAPLHLLTSQHFVDFPSSAESAITSIEVSGGNLHKVRSSQTIDTPSSTRQYCLKNLRTVDDRSRRYSGVVFMSFLPSQISKSPLEIEFLNLGSVLIIFWRFHYTYLLENYRYQSQIRYDETVYNYWKEGYELKDPQDAIHIMTKITLRTKNVRAIKCLKSQWYESTSSTVEMSGSHLIRGIGVILGVNDLINGPLTLIAVTPLHPRTYCAHVDSNPDHQ